MKSKLLYTGSEWDVPLVEKIWNTIDKMAREQFGFDHYEPQLEIITSEQMLDCYCLSPDHKVLNTDLKWVSLGDIEVGESILGFDEECQPNKYRKYQEAKVLEKEIKNLESYKVTLSSGKSFVVTGNHLWLTKKDNVRHGKHQTWRSTKELDSDTYTFKLMNTWEQDTSYEGAYLAGIFDGEGTVSSSVQSLSISQNEGLVQNRIVEYLEKIYHLPCSVVNSSRENNVKQTLIGGNLADRLELLGRLRPIRLLNKVDYNKLGTVYTSRFEDEYIISVENIGIQEIAVVRTSTGTMVVDGYPMHNSSVAMPIMYNHWSFGKTFLQNERQYVKGIQGLAYEVVINTNPCIAYLMENNTATLQALVLAHASVGHSHFFKNNYLFKGWTDADTILDYLKFARNYIKTCEQKYGAKRVENLLDACHSLSSHGIDKYKKPKKKDNSVRSKNWEKYSEETFSDLWRTVPKKQEMQDIPEIAGFPEENLLYFIEKHSPILKSWEREIVRIVRKIAQYFYPQRQTGLLNEGFACFTHHLLMTELHEQGYIDEGAYLEFLQSHTNVVAQRDWDSKYFNGINVYALGYAMLTDVKRMCIAPDEEDLKWCPQVCNTPWLDTIKDIVANYRDESFVLQFLSPKVARHFKLFSLHIKEKTPYLEVSATHDDDSFIELRKTLSEQYDLSRSVPQIEIVEVDWEGDRWMFLEHRTKNNQRLVYKSMRDTVMHMSYLWGFPVKMEYVDLDGNELEDIK